MEKNTVKNMYLEEMKSKLETINKNFQSTKQEMIEAEGRMVTRYDSTKTEVAWLANSLLVKKKKLEEAIERINIDTSLKIKVGSKVKIRQLNVNNDKNIFEVFIGKNKNQIDSNIIQLNNSSDTVKELFGKMKEDIVEINLNSIDMVVKVEEIVNDKIDEEVVNLDSIVLLEDDSLYTDYYYICDSEGGIDLELDDGTEIIVLSNKAPLASLILGKKINDEVILKIRDRETRFIIKDIM